nr:hypothetical protein C4D60_Mb01t27480 [Ipomoea trifida]
MLLGIPLPVSPPSLVGNSKDLNQGNSQQGLELGGDCFQECLIRVSFQFLVLGRPGLRHEPAAQRWATGVVARVGILAEIDGCVES